MISLSGFEELGVSEVGGANRRSRVSEPSIASHLRAEVLCRVAAEHSATTIGISECLEHATTEIGRRLRHATLRGQVSAKQSASTAEALESS